MGNLLVTTSPKENDFLPQMLSAANSASAKAGVSTPIPVAILTGFLVRITTADAECINSKELVYSPCQMLLLQIYKSLDKILNFGASVPR